MRAAVLLVTATMTSVSFAAAAPDKYGITAEEHAACDGDAMRLCMETFPDVERTLACMRQKAEQLTPTCASVFKAGLKRRHIPL